MRTASFLAGFAAVSVLAMLAIADERVALPNPTLTPGGVATDDLSQICAPGYAAAHRMRFGSHGEYMLYKAVMDEYGIPKARWHEYVVDHLIPLELGGADVMADKWPQPREESYRKDRLENEMHRQVCAGARTLDDARRQMTSGAW